VDFTETRVLIVEDDEQAKDLLLDRLLIMGIKNTIACENGKSALNKLKFQNLDLIICDWNLPLMNGLELFHAAHEENLIGKTPFLMISAENEKEKVIEAINSGIEHYIVKPFSQQKFEEEVKKLLNQEK
jgi:two-component system, chemotaxis family, chemotaxis protein CheY